MNPGLLPEDHEVPSVRHTNLGRTSVTIVIPTYNRVEKLQSCLRSVVNGDCSPVEIVVVDDASSDSTSEMIRNLFPDVTIVRHPSPTFAAGSINDGIGLARTEYVLILNDDNVIDRGMICELTSFLEHHADAGVVGPITYYLSDPRRIMYTGARFTKILRRTVLIAADTIDEGQLTRPIEVENIPNCFLLRRSLAMKVGLIDSNIFVWAGEDGSLQDKIRELGFKTVIVPQAKTWHDNDPRKTSDSIERLTPAKLYYMMRSKVAHIRLLETGYIIRLIRFISVLGVIAYYQAKVFALIDGPNERRRRFRSLLKGAIDGLFLKRGLPFT